MTQILMLQTQLKNRLKISSKHVVDQAVENFRAVFCYTISSLVFCFGGCQKIVFVTIYVNGFERSFSKKEGAFNSLHKRKIFKFCFKSEHF